MLRNLRCRRRTSRNRLSEAASFFRQSFVQKLRPLILTAPGS